MTSKTQIIPLITGCMPQRKINSCLDCGCGLGKWANILRIQVYGFTNAYIVGLDIFRHNLEFCKKYGSYDDLVLADIKNLPFKPDSFEIIVASEVIEHIEKSEGENFLAQIENLSTGRLIISTPNGNWPDNPLVYEDGTVNVFEEHKSAWSSADFSKRGYKVRAIGIRIRSYSAGRVIQQVIAGIDFMLFPAWFLPQVGKHLVAFKDRKR
jgi:2-polyprenyl-3-methyl-5-hydroxy-6-metoxy-1,4-benzoquinol methylase